MMMKVQSIILLFLTCVVTYSQEPDMQYLKGVAALQKNEYQEAVSLLTQVEGSQKENATLYLCRGEAYYKMQNYNKALADFENANTLRSDYADLWLAKTYSQIGKSGLAVDFLKKHLASVYHADENSIKQDPAFDKIQNSNEWFELWQKDWYTNGEKVIEEANFLLVEKDAGKAGQLVDEAMASDPSNAGLKAVKAQIYLEQGNNRGALSLMNQVLDKVKDNAGYFALRAKAYFLQQDFDNAIKDYNRAIGLLPEKFNYYLERSETYLQKGDYNAALKDAKFFLSLFNDDPKAIELNAKILMKQGNAVDALPYLTRNIKNDPSKPAYFIARGDAYFQTKTYAYAIKDYSMALDLDPNNGEVYLNKGLARFYLGDTEGACSDWRMAKRLGNIQAQEYLLEHCK